MINYRDVNKTFFLILFVFALLSFSPGCSDRVPPPAVIEKAKIDTKAILDSLQQSGTMVIGDIKLNSEAFYEDDDKYIINYEITSGLDSSHLATTKASVFLVPEEGVWVYDFVFDQTYERVIGTE